KPSGTGISQSDRRVRAGWRRTGESLTWHVPYPAGKKSSRLMPRGFSREAHTRTMRPRTDGHDTRLTRTCDRVCGLREPIHSPWHFWSTLSTVVADYSERGEQEGNRNGPVCWQSRP